MTNKMNTIKALKAACLTALAALAAAPAFARNFSELQIAQANEVYDSRYVGVTSTAPGNGDEQQAIRLFYVGSSTEAVVTINTTGLTFYAPAGTADATVGAAGVVAFATYANIGAVCDKINTSANYQCRMEDARRSDANDRLTGVTATGGLRNLKAIGGYWVAVSSGGGANNSTTLTETDISIGINPPADTRVVLRKCTFYGAGSANIRFSVSGVKRALENAPDGVVRNDATVVWISSAANSTATTISFDSSGVGGLAFAASNQGITGPSSGLPAGQSTVQTTPPNSLGRVVVRVASDGTTKLDSNAYLYCQWTDR